MKAAPKATVNIGRAVSVRVCDQRRTVCDRESGVEGDRPYHGCAGRVRVVARRPKYSITPLEVTFKIKTVSSVYAVHRTINETSTNESGAERDRER